MAGAANARRARMAARRRSAVSELRSLRKVADAESRTLLATELLDQLRAEEEAISQVRDEAVADLRRTGASYGEIADASGLSRSRVAQIVRRLATGR